MDRQQLLKKINQAWDDLASAYESLSDKALMEAGALEEWSIKDTIAHVTWWEEEALAYLPWIMEGKKLPRYADEYGGIDAFNAKMVEEKWELSLSEVFQERDETHRRLLDFLKKVPEEYFATETRFRRRLRLDTYGHYKIHAEAIQAWRDKRRWS